MNAILSGGIFLNFILIEIFFHRKIEHATDNMINKYNWLIFTMKATPIKVTYITWKDVIHLQLLLVSRCGGHGQSSALKGHIRQALFGRKEIFFSILKKEKKKSHLTNDILKAFDKIQTKKQKISLTMRNVVFRHLWS